MHISLILLFSLQIVQDRANCLLIAILCQIRNYTGKCGTDMDRNFGPDQLRKQMIVHFMNHSKAIMTEFVSTQGTSSYCCESVGSVNAGA